MSKVTPATVPHFVLPSLPYVCSFGVLMLVVLTGRSPHTTEGEKDGHILQWAENCISSKKTTPVKDLTHLSMDAPDDAVLRLAQLALRCTVQRTASRPSMADIANELQGIRHEVVGKEELSAAIKVDAQAEEMRIGMSLRKSLGAELEAIVSMEEEEESNGEQAGTSIQ
ncbi:unnamed protein product [Closterium sp. Yama58-4]|nr:unnamed protein product [Closterium sp. Yama58-4]